eukprot:363362-Chlamydomonas_euryale.AAC.8
MCMWAYGWAAACSTESGHMQQAALLLRLGRAASLPRHHECCCMLARCSQVSVRASGYKHARKHARMCA